MTLDEIDIRRDVVERLSRVHIDYYVTGSEAMALHGLAYRQTNDADFVVEISPADYESRLRPDFEPTYIVSPLERHPPRWLGSAIHVRAVGKADFIIRDAGDWSDSAYVRRELVQDPLVGPVWVASLEDLLLAKLEWSEGNLDGLQGRDARAIVTGAGALLDLEYLRQYAVTLHVSELLERVLAHA